MGRCSFESFEESCSRSEKRLDLFDLSGDSGLVSPVESGWMDGRTISRTDAENESTAILIFRCDHDR